MRVCRLSIAKVKNYYKKTQSNPQLKTDKNRKAAPKSYKKRQVGSRIVDLSRKKQLCNGWLSHQHPDADEVGSAGSVEEACLALRVWEKTIAIAHTAVPPHHLPKTLNHRIAQKPSPISLKLSVCLLAVGVVSKSKDRESEVAF